MSPSYRNHSIGFYMRVTLAINGLKNLLPWKSFLSIFIFSYFYKHSFSYPFSFLKFPNFPQFSLTLYVSANHLSASIFRKFSDHCLKIGSITWSINAMNRKNTFKWINMVPSERNLYQKIKNIQNNGFLLWHYFLSVVICVYACKTFF